MAVRLQSSQIKQKAMELGFHRVGIVNVPPLASAGELPQAEQTSAAALKQWLAQGYEADMAWMHNPKRQNVRQVLPAVRSIICVALNYYTPHQRPDEPVQGKPVHGKIARYGWGRDYHRILHKRLKALTLWLEAEAARYGQTIETRYYADTGPIQDKFWAQQAGIGWTGKNGNVISRDYGSWLVLGEVLTSLPLESDRPHTDHCG
ncbi:MAG: QueG-associated DUF1730 domain-containing protein, partial [Cyanobacteria bacterium P01_C01_bin.73]